MCTCVHGIYLHQLSLRTIRESVRNKCGTEVYLALGEKKMKCLAAKKLTLWKLSDLAVAQTGCEDSCRYFQYPSQTHPTHLVGFILGKIRMWVMCDIFGT